MFGTLSPVLFFGHERFKIAALPCVTLLASLAIHALLPRGDGGFEAVRSADVTNFAVADVDQEVTSD